MHGRNSTSEEATTSPIRLVNSQGGRTGRILVGDARGRGISAGYAFLSGWEVLPADPSWLISLAIVGAHSYCTDELSLFIPIEIVLFRCYLLKQQKIR